MDAAGARARRSAVRRAAAVPAGEGRRDFADGDTLRVGPLALVAHFTGGHTPGGTSWSWRSCEGGRCLDMVYADSQTPVSADDFLFTKHYYPSAIADFEHGFAVLERCHATCCSRRTPMRRSSGSAWRRAMPERRCAGERRCLPGVRRGARPPGEAHRRRRRALSVDDALTRIAIIAVIAALSPSPAARRSLGGRARRPHARFLRRRIQDQQGHLRRARQARVGTARCGPLLPARWRRLLRREPLLPRAARLHRAVRRERRPRANEYWEERPLQDDPVREKNRARHGELRLPERECAHASVLRQPQGQPGIRSRRLRADRPGGSGNGRAWIRSTTSTATTRSTSSSPRWGTITSRACSPGSTTSRRRRSSPPPAATAPCPPNTHPSRWRMLALLATAELFGMSLWFAANAVASMLRAEWQLSGSEVAWLTTAGAARLRGRHRGVGAAQSRRRGSGAAAVRALGHPRRARQRVAARGRRLRAALATRFATGFFLAGVYPPAMKMAATWFRARRGLAVGTVVGALTVGKAVPYLVHAVPGAGVNGVVLTDVGRRRCSPRCSCSRSTTMDRTTSRRDAFRGDSSAWWCASGNGGSPPAATSGTCSSCTASGRGFPPFVAASIAAQMRAHGVVSPHSATAASLLAFGIIAVGGAGCIWGGLSADRIGRERLVTIAMAAERHLRAARAGSPSGARSPARAGGAGVGFLRHRGQRAVLRAGHGERAAAFGRHGAHHPDVARLPAHHGEHPGGAARGRARWLGVGVPDARAGTGARDLEHPSPRGAGSRAAGRPSGNRTSVAPRRERNQEGPMKRRFTVGLVLGAIFTLGNIAGAVYAGMMGEMRHAGLHVVLALVGAYVSAGWLPRVAGWLTSAATGRRRCGSPELSSRLTNLEQSLDAIAVEVERVGEGQRFMTRLFTERKADDKRAEVANASRAEGCQGGQTMHGVPFGGWPFGVSSRLRHVTSNGAPMTRCVTIALAALALRAACGKCTVSARAPSGCTYETCAPARGAALLLGAAAPARARRRGGREARGVRWRCGLAARRPRFSGVARTTLCSAVAHGEHPGAARALRRTSPARHADNCSGMTLDDTDSRSDHGPGAWPSPPFPSHLRAERTCRAPSGSTTRRWRDSSVDCLSA